MKKKRRYSRTYEKRGTLILISCRLNNTTACRAKLGVRTIRHAASITLNRSDLFFRLFKFKNSDRLLKLYSNICKLRMCKNLNHLGTTPIAEASIVSIYSKALAACIALASRHWMLRHNNRKIDRLFYENAIKNFQVSS